MTRIGVIGGGNIGETIGEAWRRTGHDVVYASRSPAPPRTVAIRNPLPVPWSRAPSTRSALRCRGYPRRLAFRLLAD